MTRRDNAVPRRRRHLAFVGTITIFATGCGHGAGGSDVFTKAVDPGARAHFFHHVVADEAPGGRDCCSDVVAVGDLDGEGVVDVVRGRVESAKCGVVG
jgi:hypothetical protein